jgi:hypothetical protein
MTIWPAFAALFRAFSGEPTAPDLEAGWADLLTQLHLPPGAIAERVPAGARAPHFRYRHFTRAKKDGGRREITEPESTLKRIQKAVLRRYLAGLAAHPAAVAYRPGTSTAHHVWPHAGASIIVTADVQDFFPNTRTERVEAWWRTRVGGDLAAVLTRLTTYCGGLPQGAPTSPALSNHVNYELDVRLACRAEAAGARYTRYCDDLAFSWRHDVGPPADFESAVRAVLHEFGYTLHPEKGWRICRGRDEPEITGVVLTRWGRVRLPAPMKSRMRNLARSADPRDAVRLEGYRGYEAMMSKRPAVLGAR